MPPFVAGQGQAGGMKRPQPSSATLPGNATKSQTVHDTENQWTCSKCGNMNYGERQVCNMRTCGAPRSLDAWDCPSCGNQNRENRPYCNMRGCGLMKPGLTINQLNAVQSMPHLQGHQQRMAVAGAAPTPAGGAPPGSWVCQGCSNTNWPQRMTCNGNKGQCGLPRSASGMPMMGAAPAVSPWATPQTAASVGGAPAGSWTCPACQNVNWPLRATCNGSKGQCGQPRPAAGCMAGMGGMAGMAHVGGGGGASAPPGSWVCTSCQNVNFSLRTNCNAKNCGLPRSTVDGGPPAAAQGKQFSSFPPAAQSNQATPEGSWTCTACSNVNWPDRSSCNGKNCGRPRHEVEGEAPFPGATTHQQATHQPGTTPPGSWICPACNNINWPERSACNKNGCGLPRPA